MTPLLLEQGSWAARQPIILPRQGASTLLLEQFSRGHTFGSSHGDNRIIRLIYEKQFYTELMKHAYAEWRKVEKESGKDLLFTTGSVIIGPEGHELSPRYGCEPRSCRRRI